MSFRDPKFNDFPHPTTIFDLCIEHERDREVHVYLEGEIGGEVENNEDAIELNENNGDSGDSEDCLDGDYDLGREEVDAENNRIDEDDDLFNNHVDGEESEEARGGDEEGSEEDLSDNSKGFFDSDNFDSDKASDDENGPKYPSFNSIDTYNPQFQLENRFCVRHLHGNMKRAGFTGLAYKKALWMAARATTTTEFDVMMKKDFILEAREKQIYSMLEWIREFLMTRLQQNRDRAASRWKGKICPRIKKILQKNGDKGSSDCIPIKANDIHYEISCFDGSRCAVDLQRHTCSCRRWDLSGIPYEVPLKHKGIKGKKKPVKLKRQQGTVKCKFCGDEGHNKKGCQKRKDAEAAEIERAMQEVETLFSVNVETQVSIDLSSQVSVETEINMETNQKMTARKRTIIPTRSSTQITLQLGKA
ncbi:UNVERIFIED_CONTAM: hypothetical protein Scaly_2703400 [Sesamum calycinum]|uniref:CCHC-type domain-containing protein n=1 Tax=Sesamum calycinum TaxID=2727403 RepID=A0AAW2J4J6_9LAMI